MLADKKVHRSRMKTGNVYDSLEMLPQYTDTHDGMSKTN